MSLGGNKSRSEWGGGGVYCCLCRCQNAVCCAFLTWERQLDPCPRRAIAQAAAQGARLVAEVLFLARPPRLEMISTPEMLQV